MAEYILDVMSQTSKLDWAFPFQRTGAFPIDRSAVFSSLADAQNYALGLDENKLARDERALGGTSYVGQVISVYEAGIEADEENGIEAVPASVNAYIITPARSLMKLASTTASGDIASDVADLQGKAEQLIADLEAAEAAIEKKAEKSYVEEELAKKADAETINAELAKKAVKTEVEAELAKKADAEAVNAELALKAVKADVDAELAKKADAQAINEALALKANAQDVTDALALKANSADVYVKNDVYTKSEVEAYVSGQIGSAGHLKREIVEALPAAAEANVDTIYMLKKVSGLVTQDHYEEYMVINGAWELIGDTYVDLSNYAEISYVDGEIDKVEEAIAKKADQTALDTANENIAKKADAETVNAALELKADKTQVATDIANAIAPLAVKADVEGALALKADKDQVATDIANAIAPLAVAEDVNAELLLKADKTQVATDIENAVAPKADKTYVDEELAKKADKAETLAGYGIGDAYTKNEVDAALLLKASQQDHLELADVVNGKADKATTLAGYGITDAYTSEQVYTKEEVDAAIEAAEGRAAVDAQSKADAAKAAAISDAEGKNAALKTELEGAIATAKGEAIEAAAADAKSKADAAQAAAIADTDAKLASYAKSADVYTKNDVYTKAETETKIDEKIASVTGGESAADVKLALETYRNAINVEIWGSEAAAWAGTDAEGKSTYNPQYGNDTRIDKLEAVGAQANVIESISTPDAALEIKSKNVALPLALAGKAGLVRGAAVVDGKTADNSVSVDNNGYMFVNSLNVNKLVQTEGEYLILNGGGASV